MTDMAASMRGVKDRQGVQAFRAFQLLRRLSRHRPAFYSLILLALFAALALLAPALAGWKRSRVSLEYSLRKGRGEYRLS